MTQLTLPEPKKTKRERLLALLQTGRKLSKQEILRETGIWNSGHVVWLMRGDGINVQTEMVKRDGETFALYFIEPEPKAA